MNKIISRRVKRARRRSKHTTRKRYRKYRKHYTRKHVKRTQCQGKGRMRRQTRSKRGGFSLFKSKPTKSTEFNFSLPSGEDVQIQGKGLAYVTKLGGFLSQSDRVEQIIIYQKKNEQGKASGNYFIARCVSSDCSEGKNMESKILETTQFEQVFRGDSGTGEYDFTTTTSDKYRIKPVDKFFSQQDENNNTKLSNFLANNSVNLLAQAAAAAAAAAEARAAADATAADARAAADATAADATAADARAADATAADARAAADAKAAADAYVPPTSDKDREFQELIDSINFSTPEIDDIRKMLKVTNSFDTMCSFLCNPDECDEQMLQKLRQKYMEKIEQKSVSEIGDATKIFDDILNENLLLILENLYIQSTKMNKEEFKNLVNTCSAAIAKTFDRRNILHKIVFTLYSKFLKSYKISENESKQNLENMQKLLDLLNSMTPENMQKLLDLLNSMTPENMQKLLDLLNSMTPENMQKLLDLLNSMTPETMSDLLFYLIHDIEKNNITTILDDYIKLDAESMAQLLELYSFIEKREYNDNKSLFWIHRYENGKTPFSQKLIRNTKHKQETCKSVNALHEQSNQIDSNEQSMFNFKEDEEFKKVLEECKKYPPLPEVVTGGGRKRRTLKKKRGGNSKR